MRKTYRKIFILMMAMMILLVGCGDNEGTNKGEDKKKVTTEQSQFGFDTQLAIYEGEDGWLHYFACETIKGDDKPTYYSYDAYNLKYKKIVGYEVEVVEEDGSVDGIYPRIPYMLLNNDYDTDYDTLEMFFKSRRPVEILTSEEEGHLNIGLLDKDLIIELFNTAIESEYLEEGRFYYFPEADMFQEEMLNGYQWQVAFFIQHGVLIEVNIELIYEDGSYLTDIVWDGNGDEFQNQLVDMINEIENKIIEQQSFIADEGLYIDNETINCGRLKTMLAEIEGSYK